MTESIALELDSMALEQKCRDAMLESSGDAAPADPSLSTTADRPAALGQCAPGGAVRGAQALQGGGLWTVFCCGLLGGVLACVLMTAFDEFFQLPSQIFNLMQKAEKTAEEAARINSAVWQMCWRQAALHTAMLGVSIAGCIGLGAGIATRSRGGVAAGVVAGVIIGAALGSCGGYVGAIIQSRVEAQRAIRLPDPTEQMMIILGAHAVEWSLVGIGSGVAAGFAVGQRRSVWRCPLAAVGGAIVAAPLYALLAVVLFPIANSDLAVPRAGWNRLFWTMCAATFIALAIARTLRSCPEAIAKRFA